jgi:hypothetical protein
MTRDERRVWLIAACYGLWAGFCAVAAFAFADAFWLGFWNPNRSLFGGLIESLPYAAFTVIVAALGWAILHLRSREPGPGAYIALAIAIVIVVHSALMVSASVGAPPEGFFAAFFLSFLFHFWFTIPIAAGATGLFVLCLKRWKALE